jgi:calpain-7
MPLNKPLLFLAFWDMSTAIFHAVEQRARAAERNASLAKSRHDVLEATITAAELYMQARGLASSSTDRARLDTKCKELLTKAETIKKETDQTEVDDGVADSRLPSRPLLKQPTSNRKLTTREEIILLEGSKLNGFVFPPWKEDPKSEEFLLKDGEELFVDSPSLHLSPLQLKTFAGWKRPWEALAGIDISQDGLKLPTQPTMQRLRKIDLVQDMTSDCSVVASLCAGSARAEKGHPRVKTDAFRAGQ